MQEADLVSIQHTVVWSSFAVAFLLGGLMNKTNFCTMGAVSDILNMGDWNRMRMWLCAIAVAIIGTQALAATGWLDLSKSFYTQPPLTWLSNIIGGLMFGFGMVLASGCGSKTLVRLGGGSLKALVVFVVLGLFAFMTMRGVFGVWRVGSIDTVQVILASGQDLPRLLAGKDASAISQMRWVCGLLIGGALLIFCLFNAEFRQRDSLLGGIGVGLGIVAIWYISGKLGFVGEHPKTLEEAFIATNSGRPNHFRLSPQSPIRSIC